MFAVAAAHEKAVEAGLRIMEEGGDACDAAVAVSLALGVVEPFYSGLGGGGVALVWREEEKKARFVDFSNECPVGMEPGIFECDESGEHIGHAHSRGHRSILIPGLLRGLEAIHREFGRRPWGELFASAIRLADEGFKVGWFYRLQQEEPRFQELCAAYPELGRIHTVSGEPLAEGALLRQPDLAGTLREIAEEGADAFYEGALAKAILDEIRSGGGYLGGSDLKNYRVRWMAPLSSRYRNLRFLTAPPPSSGLLLIQILNFLEVLLPEWDAADESARGLALARAMRAAFRDRFSVYGDPYHFDMPVERLLSKEYAAAAIDEERASGVFLHDMEPGSTTHFTIVDAQGNVVSHTQTLGMNWGSGVSPQGTGILLNNHTNWMDPRPGRGNSLGVGRRPVAGYAPTLVFEEEKLRLGVGSPGSYRIPTAVAQVILNLFYRNMTLQEAVEAPRMHLDIGPLHAEDAVDGAILDSARQSGFEVSRYAYPHHFFGGVHAVEVSDGGCLTAFGDPRRAGNAETRE